MPVKKGLLKSLLSGMILTKQIASREKKKLQKIPRIGM